jgi:predicted RNA binding protein YcfA (HicA-like mRNA interferase family)
MPPVPAVRGDRLVKALERAGFAVTRVNAALTGCGILTGVPPPCRSTLAKDVPKGTLRAVLQDCGLTVDELLNYL